MPARQRRRSGADMALAIMLLCLVAGMTPSLARDACPLQTLVCNAKPMVRRGE